MNGYFFVVGFSTGALFEGSLTYSSLDKTALHDVSVKVDVSFKLGPFSVSGGHAYRDIKDTKSGSTSFKSDLNVTGSSNEEWNREDIFESHDKF